MFWGLIVGGSFFLFWPEAGLANQPRVRDSNPGAPFQYILCGAFEIVTILCYREY